MKSSDLGFSFFDEPTAVYEYMAGKKPEIHFDYDEIMHDAHKKTFTIAKMTNLDLLKDMQGSLTKAFKEGIGFEEWKQGVKPMLAKKGWLGNVRVKDPNTGEEKEIYVGHRRLKTIYDTNMRTAYAKARYESQMQSLGEYFRYTAVLDGRTRASHRRLHGKTLPKTDPFWDTNYPPNGWNCRCKVQVLTKAECKARGITPLADGSFLPKAAEKDFAYNPGKVEKIDEIFKDKKDAALQSLTSPKAKKALQELLKEFEHERDIYVWQKGLEQAIDEIIVKDNQKVPINIFQVGFLSKILADLASKILNKSIESGGIVLTKKELTHASPKRKQAYQHAFRVEEMKRIVEVLQDEDKAYVDLREGKNNIVFIFDDEADETRLNLIPIEVSKTHKKFKVKNYVITLDKNIKEDILGAIKGGEIKKLK
ncbi:phage head morphogenesis protein [Campylobacter curvus]|uniref:phage head morphogenesis protein n=1 Tax=Campylobacter curvus TaxID=200 RepID=UPI0014703858|nr:phage minor head protein [Campylobacter curvus]